MEVVHMVGTFGSYAVWWEDVSSLGYDFMGDTTAGQALILNINHDFHLLKFVSAAGLAHFEHPSGVDGPVSA